LSDVVDIVFLLVLHAGKQPRGVCVTRETSKTVNSFRPTFDRRLPCVSTVLCRPSGFRIRQEKNGGAWCPKAQISSEVREYLEIDLDEDHLVTWTETQGRWGNGQGQEFTEAFTVEYWRKSIGRWVEYKDSRDSKVRVFALRSGNRRSGPDRSFYRYGVSDTSISFVARHRSHRERFVL